MVGGIALIDSCSHGYGSHLIQADAVMGELIIGEAVAVSDDQPSCVNVLLEEGVIFRVRGFEVSRERRGCGISCAVSVERLLQSSYLLEVVRLVRFREKPVEPYVVKRNLTTVYDVGSLQLGVDVNVRRTVLSHDTRMVVTTLPLASVIMTFWRTSSNISL